MVKTAFQGSAAKLTPPAPLENDDTVTTVSLSTGWSNWLDQLCAALVATAGVSSQVQNVSGVALPRTAGADTIVALQQILPAVVSCWKRVSYQSNAGLSKLLTSDGQSSIGMNASMFTLPIQKYLACPVDTTDASTNSWRRTYLGDSYEPGMASGFTAEIVSQIRQLVDYWQGAVQASADALIACGANGATSICPDVNIKAFWAACRHVTEQLDSLAEVIPPDISGSIRAAWNASVAKVKALGNDAAKMAGNVAAEAADEAGSIFASFLKGFLGDATTVALAVACIVVYVHFYA